MQDNTFVINLGELSEPVTVFIEKISNAIGTIYEPRRIRHVAQAEAEAEKIKAVAQIEIIELQQRAVVRFVAEEAKKQANIESITRKALDELNEDAQPQDMEDDWIVNFFDKCRLVSDEEMQGLWAKVLAREANSPGKYSRRTVNFLSSMDKSEAMVFTHLCSFAWSIGTIVPLVYDIGNEIYVKKQITFSSLKHLDEIGLITYNDVTGFAQLECPKVLKTFYCGTPINVEFKKDIDNKLPLGKVLLSRTGKELAPITGSRPNPEFLDYVLDYWAKQGYVTYSDWPRAPQASVPKT